MDAMERLTWDADIAVGVLGRGGEFLLVPLTEPGKISEAVTDDARRRGFRFCGVVAVTNGQASAQWEPYPDAIHTMLHAALAFAQEVADRLKPKQAQGDAVDWLERLWSLPDTRD